MLNCAKINGLQTQKKERALEYLNVPWTTTSQNFPLCLCELSQTASAVL